MKKWLILGLLIWILVPTVHWNSLTLDQRYEVVFPLAERFLIENQGKCFAGAPLIIEIFDNYVIDIICVDKYINSMEMEFDEKK